MSVDCQTPLGTEICVSLEGHTNRIADLSCWADAESTFSSSIDSTLRAWDARRQKTKKNTHRHGPLVSSVAFTPNGSFVISGSRDGKLRIWNTTSGEVEVSIRAHSHAVNDVAVTPDGQCVLSASDDKFLCVWHLGSRKLLHTFTGHTS